MGFYVPWVINGSKHAARLFRRTFQQQAGEGSGVSRPGDLKVQALNVPGTGVRIAPGGGVAQSRDTSASARESYGPILDQELIVSEVPGTGSSGGRRDLVVLEITDPEMESVTYPAPTTPEGWQDGSNFTRITVIPGVGASVKSLDDVTDPAYTHVTGVTLAAINWPASTATITNAMIEDLRELQSPLSLRQQDLVTITSATSLPNTGEHVWPVASQQLVIPARANEVTIMCRIFGFLVTVNWVGVEFRLRVGGPGAYVYSPISGLATDTDPGSIERVDKVIPMRVTVPEAMRGTSQPVVILAKKTGGLGTLSTSARTAIEFDSTLAEKIS